MTEKKLGGCRSIKQNQNQLTKQTSRKKKLYQKTRKYSILILNSIMI